MVNFGSKYWGSRFGVLNMQETYGNLEKIYMVTDLRNRIQHIHRPNSRVAFIGSVSNSGESSGAGKKLGIWSKKKTPIQIQFRSKTLSSGSLTPGGSAQSPSIQPPSPLPLHLASLSKDSVGTNYSYS